MSSEEEILNVDTASTMSHYSQDNLPQKTLRIKPSLAPLWTTELHHMKSTREEAWLHWTSLHSKRLPFDPSVATEGQEAVMSWGKMGKKNKEKKKKKAGSSAVTHVGDGLCVGCGQAQVTDHLQAAVVGGQVQRSSAVLEQRKERHSGEMSLFTDNLRDGDTAESMPTTHFKEA